jgi:hypothetical protein
VNFFTTLGELQLQATHLNPFFKTHMCMIFFVGTHLTNCPLEYLMSSVLYQRLPHRLTMDIIEGDKLVVDKVWLKHWDCTLVFDIAGLEGQHGTLHYTVLQTQCNSQKS